MNTYMQTNLVLIFYAAYKLYCSVVVPIVRTSRGEKVQLTISQSLYKVRLIKYDLIILLSVSVELVIKCINVYYALLGFNFERVL